MKKNKLHLGKTTSNLALVRTTIRALTTRDLTVPAGGSSIVEQSNAKPDTCSRRTN